MSDFNVGDVVVRIGPSHPEAPKGAVARVLRVYRSWGIRTLELTIKPVGDHDGWEAGGWRKLDAPKTEIAARIRACRPVGPKVPA